MKNGFFIIVLGLSLLQTACPITKKIEINPPSFSPSPSPSPNKPACGTANDFSLPESNVIHQTVKVKKERQRVIRKNCAGTVHSDQIETVKDPNQSISITASHKFKGVDTADIGWHLNNRTTCDGTRKRFSDTRLFSSQTIAYSFHVDTSPTTFYVHVKKDAVNYIDYRISVCKPGSRIEKGYDTCDSEVKENGILILKVQYSEEELPGVLEKAPTPEECKRSSKTLNK